METIALSGLAPILAAVLGPMLVFVAASMRYQHLDSTKTRGMIEESSRENRRLIEESSRENRRLIEESSTKTRGMIEESSRENRCLIEKNRDLIEASNRQLRDLITASHAEISGSLADARERLARIEGRLGITPPPRHGGSEADGDARAA